MWKAIKCILALLLGCPLLAGFSIFLFGKVWYGEILYYISVFIWVRYVVRYYFPSRKEEPIQRKEDDDDDNEVEFKDL
jgi:hypothetical protein